VILFLSLDICGGIEMADVTLSIEGIDGDFVLFKVHNGTYNNHLLRLSSKMFVTLMREKGLVNSIIIHTNDEILSKRDYADKMRSGG